MTPLICFIGVDGSGKTTSAVSLYRRLSANGYECQYIHHTFRLTDFVPSLMGGYLRNNVSSAVKVNNPDVVDSTSQSSGKLKTMVEIALSLVVFIESIIGYSVETKCLTSKRIVIYDRYMYDRIMGYFDVCPKWLSQLYLKMIPVPDVVFVLDIPHANAFSRKKEGSSNFREKQRKQFLNLAKHLKSKNVFIIDTCKNSIDKVNSQIFNYVESVIGSD